MRIVANISAWLIGLSLVYLTPISLINCFSIWFGAQTHMPFLNIPLEYEITTWVTVYGAMMYWGAMGILALLLTLSPVAIGIIWLAFCNYKKWLNPGAGMTFIDARGSNETPLVGQKRT